MLTKYILLLIACASLFRLNAQHKKPVSRLLIDTLAQGALGFTSYNDSNHALVFEKISFAQFSTCKKKYRNRIDTLQKTIHWDSSFSLRTSRGSITFTSDTYNQHYYIGALPSLNLYMTGLVSAPSAVQEFYFIDQHSGKKFVVSTPFDNSFDLPLLSPGGNRMIIRCNNIFNDHESFISVIKVNTYGSKYTLLNSSFYFNRMSIDDIAWINETSFVLATLPVVDEETGQTQPAAFFRVTLAEAKAHKKRP